MTWTYNAAHRRFEDWDNTGGRPRLLRAIVDSSVDNSDLTRDNVPSLPAPDELQGKMGGQSVDWNALNKFYVYLTEQHAAVDPNRQGEANAAKAQTAGNAGGAANASADISGGKGYAGILDDAQTRVAKAEQSNLYLDWQEATNKLDQAEDALRYDMAKNGVDPGYYFSPYGGSTAPGTATDPAHVSQRYGVAPDASGIKAQTAEDAVTGRAAIMARTQTLQRLATQWDRQKEGGQWLSDSAKLTGEYNDLSREIAWNEHLADTDPKQDRNLRPSLYGGWVHSGTGSDQGVARLHDLKRQMDARLAQRNPDQYMWVMQQRMARTKTEPYQGWQQPDHVVTPEEYSGHVPWNPRAAAGAIPHEQEYDYLNPDTFARGGVIPRFAEGGGYGASGYTSAYANTPAAYPATEPSSGLHNGALSSEGVPQGGGTTGPTVSGQGAPDQPPPGPVSSPGLGGGDPEQGGGSVPVPHLDPALQEAIDTYSQGMRELASERTRRIAVIKAEAESALATMESQYKTQIASLHASMAPFAAQINTEREALAVQRTQLLRRFEYRPFGALGDGATSVAQVSW